LIEFPPHSCHHSRDGLPTGADLPCYCCLGYALQPQFPDRLFIARLERLSS
jgi:hypothetical protein